MGCETGLAWKRVPRSSAFPIPSRVDPRRSGPRRNWANSSRCSGLTSSIRADHHPLDGRRLRKRSGSTASVQARGTIEEQPQAGAGEVGLPPGLEHGRGFVVVQAGPDQGPMHRIAQFVDRGGGKISFGKAARGGAQHATGVTIQRQRRQFAKRGCPSSRTSTSHSGPIVGGRASAGIVGQVRPQLDRFPPADC